MSFPRSVYPLVIWMLSLGKEESATQEKGSELLQNAPVGRTRARGGKHDVWSAQLDEEHCENRPRHSTPSVPRPCLTLVLAASAGGGLGALPVGQARGAGQSVRMCRVLKCQCLSTGCGQTRTSVLSLDELGCFPLQRGETLGQGCPDPSPALCFAFTLPGTP